jgi:aminoglycoside/choline kinase family phosphotransferase
MSTNSHELRQWVDEQWPHLSQNDSDQLREINPAGTLAPEWQALPGDAGFRRYFRLASEPPLLAVYAPPATEPNPVFLKLAAHLRQHGVLAPAVAAVDLARGFLLIEDLGPTLMRQELNDDSVEGLYAEALSCLLHLQRCPTESLDLPVYSRERLRQEMNLFSDWFVPKLLGHNPTEVELAMLNTWFTHLENSALEQTQVFVHRDYHSRNLIYRNGSPPGVIDFQDAVTGPVTYDLVSLLRDCYIRWPESSVERWALCYANIAMQAGVMPPVSEERFMRWFDWMGLQRHIKVLGIFARLSLRDGKHGYLNDLPLVIRYTLEVARRYKEGEEFVAWFEEKLMPLVRQQPWWIESQS